MLAEAHGLCCRSTYKRATEKVGQASHLAVEIVSPPVEGMLPQQEWLLVVELAGQQPRLGPE